ncbi:MAG: Hsp20/alpha crystallin family protein [Prolixibacteraceae bacterium]|nr:Hsp20/alpha crystallin family protein [Prolixibacteraceae bacterium]MBN2774427.1 Hsp20/alpha crystallin family protein [Prolixibacteraceae bacterium]
MKLVKFGNPYYHVNKSLVDDLFDSFLFNDSHAGYSNHNVATNIFETEKDFRIEMVLPGFSKEEVSLNYHNDVLSVKAEKEVKEEDKNNYLRREFGTKNIEKQFNIPDSIDTEKINAKFENGILVITLPKKEEAVEKAPLAISIS